MVWSKSSVFLWAYLLLGVAACGGGGGGGGDNSGPPPVSNADLGGLWIGNTTNSASPGSSQTLYGVTTDGGEFRFLSFDTYGQFIGTLSSSGNSISGNGLGWAPIGYTWMDGSVLTSITLSGTISERTSITGNWTAGTGETGTATFSYDTLHTRTPSLDTLSANWYYSDGYDSVTLSINASGIISGSDTGGCVYNGQATIPNSSYNTYRINIDVSSCGDVNGSYGGLGFLADDQNTNDTLIISVDDGTLAVILGMLRQ